MKSLKFSISIFTLLAFMFVGIACSGGQKTDAKGKEYTSTWICPMHCEGSGSDEPGTCPVCGMDYVKNEEHQSDGHHHHEDGHDHGDHDGHQH